MQGRDFLIKAKNQVSDFWQSKNRAQKIRIALAAVGAIAIFSFFIFYISKPKYVPLYSNLDTKDAAAIVKKLEEMKVAYELEDGGETILVDPEYKYKTRISLAQEGLPKGGAMGFEEVFSKNRLGTTDWERQIQYNQALQGELKRTLEEMAEVEKASIYIVQQEKSLFIEPDSKNEPSAAVFLKLRPGAEMDEQGVSGIINLISYAVKGLKPENVTVIDEYGRILSDVISSPEEIDKQALSNQLLIQNDFQKRLQLSVQSLLEQVFGPGNVAVRVNAKLNFDKRSVQSKLFSPTDEETGEGILRSIQEMKEHFSGTSGAAPGGTPGVDSNVPGYQQVTTGDSEHQRSETIKNYDINETHEDLTVAPGAVDKLTVSVVVNRELDQNEKNSIVQMVGNAIGYDPDRDQVSVEGIAFKNDLADFFAGEKSRQEQRARLRNFLILGAILLGILSFVIYKVVSNRKKRRLEEEERIAEEMLEMQQAAAAQEVDEPLELERSAYEKIEKHARRRPEDVAKVLRTWLSEDPR